MSKRHKQRMFNRVWKALREQGRPSRDERSGACVYRTKTGEMCAAGHLFTQTEHQKIKEQGRSATVFELLIKQSIITRPVLVHNADFVVALQNIHDGAPPDPDLFVLHFEREMRRLAHEHGLEVPE